MGVNADADKANKKGVTPKNLCEGLKDPELKKTMEGLINMTSNSTKVIRGTEIKKEQKARKQSKNTEIENLKLSLKKSLDEKGITDLRACFKRFDTNGDGYFNEIEFGCAFTVMGINFNIENLRKLIRVTDKNMDGRIDYAEFESMIMSVGQSAEGI